MSSEIAIKKKRILKMIPFLGGDGKQNVVNITLADVKMARMLEHLSLLLIIYSEKSLYTCVFLT